MSKHEATVRWQRGEAEFRYESYVRDHTWTFGSGSTVSASAAPEYKGNPALVNPEEALVGALSSCHMLTYLAVAARKGFVVESYEDHAEGVLEKNADGRLAITRTWLRPKITYGGDKKPTADEERALHETAHRGCFIANSVKTEVVVEAAP
jgi:organic hydroperoxide reductase OsmC/OhrA